ncbi:MAG: tryptophan synthase subunit alpha [Armatimonadetes bacterium]|nr:tryptophan synthase subunit alpha [Anaerolineae bacterium]
MFTTAHAEQRAAFLPYFPIGYPTYADSVAAIAAMASENVDGFEIGIPFSDPLADGPVNQAASQISLDNGTTVTTTLDAVRELRSQGVTQPMLMFSYLNPLLAYGTARFVQDAHVAGADGLMIPDLPPDEAHLFAEVCAQTGMALVFFLAPTSSPSRIALVAQQATGFIYVVPITGITGARTELPPDLVEFIGRVRAQAQQPLVMGFGISTPEHARVMHGLVNGFIVGSALVKAGAAGGEAGTQAVRALTASLRQAR